MTDADDLKLPPRRQLPPEVRDRLRASVLGGVRSPFRARLDRARPPLAVAASVAVLAAGAAIVAQSVHDSGDPAVSPPSSTAATPLPPPLDRRVADGNMDRCWAAVLAAGKAEAVPDRSTWRAVFALPFPHHTMTAVRADGRPLFCETTQTSVTVSDPNAQPSYASGTGTAALVATRGGFLAGVVDPSWYHLITNAHSPTGSESQDVPFVQDGIFMTRGRFATGPGVRLTVRRAARGEADHRLLYRTTPPARPGETPAPLWAYPELDLPAPAPPLVAVTDRPAAVPDRSSETGAALSECIARSDSAVIDPDFWEPVVLARTGRDRTVLARIGDRIAICMSSVRSTDPDPVSTSHVFSEEAGPVKPGEPIPYVIHIGANAHAGPPYQMMVVGTLRADVATMELFTPDQQRLPLTVANGGFGAVYPVDPQGPERPAFTAVLKDRSGKELYRGAF